MTEAVRDWSGTAPDLAGTISGWRQWLVDPGGLLRSVSYNSKLTVWEPMVPLRAACCLEVRRWSWQVVKRDDWRAVTQYGQISAQTAAQTALFELERELLRATVSIYDQHGLWRARMQAAAIRGALRSAPSGPAGPGLEWAFVDEGVHQAPYPGCLCGVYAATGPEPLDYEAPVWGRVHLWGRVICHTRGWRAEHAYPAELFTLDRQLLPALERYGVPVTVAKRAPGTRGRAQRRIRLGRMLITGGLLAQAGYWISRRFML